MFRQCIRITQHDEKAVSVLCMTQKATVGVLLMLLASLLIACGNNTPAGQLDPMVTNTPIPQSAPIAETETPTVVPSEPSTPTPANLDAAESASVNLCYNLPPAVLTSATGLYASPNRSEFIVPVTIPEGEAICVMGRNATGSHLRVVWNTGVGWVPVSFTDYNGQRDRLQALAVFEREPPACAEPITTQFGLSSEWTSDKRQRLAVVVDLFRSKYGPFPGSALSLKVNGVNVDTSRRQIVEHGQFSLKDVVLALPQDAQQGDTIGYLLETTSDEELTFIATIFSIPLNCQWNID